MRKIIFVPSIIILIIFFMSATALAASGNIEGHVKDAQTGKSLPGANVFLKGTSMGAASNENGEYIIRNVTIGSYTIRVSYIGYKSEEFTIKIKKDTTLKQDFKLIAVGVKGKTVVVTAQASGQNAAINEQLSSSQIKNVVSAARIQELPDANAAESVGRLPGVSLVREGGEATQIVIRGLAPQYNLVTIDGVQIPGNQSSSRAVDVSMISSSMLGGIEVTKAITPDMDAAVLGGSVNFQMRKAKETKAGTAINLLAQGGYNDLTNIYGNYNLVGSTESRFFDSRLGIFAEINIERRNLTSNRLGASYSLNGPELDKVNPVYINALNLYDVPSNRQRYGATVVMDYKFSDVKIGFMNFVSSSDTKSQLREESYNLIYNTHDYSTKDQRNKLNAITNLLDFEKAFPLFTVDAKLSHSYSENSTPDALTFGFEQNLVGLANVNYQRLSPQAIPPLAKNDLSQTFLQNISESNSFYRNRQLSASLDFQSNINFSQNITSVLKFGGTYKYTIRSYNYFVNNKPLYLTGGNIFVQSILNAFPWMGKTVPNANSLLPITLFADPNFNYGNFLGGDYPMGVATNVDLMHQVANVINNVNLDTVQSVPYTWQGQEAYNGHSSITYDYSGNEYQSAGYIMSTIKFGQDIILLPGVRYQQLVTSYTAPRGIQTSLSYEYHDTTIEETHGFLLPMVHLILKPLSWVQLHLAYTNTLNYPPVNAIVPRIDVGFSSVIWNNYALNPAHSTNYDAILSIYNNDIGLFTIDGFLKHIKDLIFPSTTYIINPANYPGIPNTTKGEPLSTYINNPNIVDVWGIELDWQTHFWYLPGPLSGLVLSINYTHIFSQAKYPLTTVTTVYLPKYKQIVNNTFYTDRLIYQPNNIANLAVGYDYKGFSARVSMLLQANVFQGDNFWPELRVNTAEYVRWDLSVKQDLPWLRLQTFFDLNNINNAKDVNINQGSNFPNSEQFYGLTADLGFRWNL